MEPNRIHSHLTAFSAREFQLLWIEHQYAVVQKHGNADPENIWNEQKCRIFRDPPELDYSQQYHQPEQNYYYQSIRWGSHAEECCRPGDIDHKLGSKDIDSRLHPRAVQPLSPDQKQRYAHQHE